MHWEHGLFHWTTREVPTPHSPLENSKDREAWRATVHVVAKSRTRLSTHSEDAEKQDYSDSGRQSGSSYKTKMHLPHDAATAFLDIITEK